MNRSWRPVPFWTRLLQHGYTFYTLHSTVSTCSISTRDSDRFKPEKDSVSPGTGSCPSLYLDHRLTPPDTIPRQDRKATPLGRHLPSHDSHGQGKGQTDYWDQTLGPATGTSPRCRRWESHRLRNARRFSMSWPSHPFACPVDFQFLVRLEAGLIFLPQIWW